MILRLGNVYAVQQSVSLSLCHYEHKMQLGPCLAIKVCTSLVIITFAVAQRGDEFLRSWTRCQTDARRPTLISRGAEGTEC